MPWFKPGRWVKFPAPRDARFAGAHRTPDGCCVGIAAAAIHHPVTGVELVPECVYVQGPGKTDHEFNGESVRIPARTIQDAEYADPLMDAPLPRIEHLLTPDVRAAREIVYRRILVSPAR